ncbi:hypothetical protein BGZ76_008294 [Entomortierella beljakovae]|nr:hypothetical protein BGZ76_008294 [Entomortierella beljakovae]
MLGNGYKERLLNGQNNVSSLLPNISKQASSTVTQQQQLFAEDNEPADSIFKHTFPTKLTNNDAISIINNAKNAVVLPPVPAPVLESNSSSRHSFQRRPSPQIQQRSSRLPNASFNLGRILDQFPDLGSSFPEVNSIPNPKNFSFTLGSSLIGNGSRWDMPRQSIYESNSNSDSMSNSPGIEGMSLNCGVNNSQIMEAGINDETTPTNVLMAVVTIQRAIRRFLGQKKSKTNKPLIQSSVSNAKLHINTNKTAMNGSILDMEVLQQTCLRQSEEINQLKELMSKLLHESEEDRRKLRQRDQEIEEMMKQQRLVQSTSSTLGLDSLTSKAAARFNNSTASNGALGLSGSNISTSSTAASFSSFGLPSITTSREDAVIPSAGLEHQLTGNTLGIPADDFYESNLSYSSSIGGPIHPLALPSRSNSITSLQSQQQQPSGQGLSIKTNQSLYTQQYHGLMDMVDSPSTSEFGSDALTSAYGTGSRGLANAHVYSSQNSFPLLAHRNSGSFSSSSRNFDSPALEQQNPYPWNAPAGLTHSQSWADDMIYGYENNISSPSQFQQPGLGHSAGFDPSFINQQFSHGNQQQQGQQHQGLPPHRNNYRRHSEKSVHMDYQMCVDRILQATDQQASIHLQQKLKTSPPEQKIQIIDAILGQAYPLMSNRFGNFLIQRCFEFGSPQQIEILAQSMRGNILTLACDPFGCHVVQKALDNVEEDCKARIVTEMFRKIRETIVHRYACHVWQKVFEIRWTDAPPAVMTYVNSAVAGRWASVAVDETGSLVVQNIFENCAEHDKRPVLNEILQSVTTIAKGQWGNWVIQHILEHGAPVDRATVTQKILEDAVCLSLDQYASKVVEKALRMAATQTTAAQASSTEKSGSGAIKSTESNNNEGTAPITLTVNGNTIRLTQEDIMSQYIQIVCDGVPDRPRIPLIDIAADQYGNYIVQYILTSAGPQHRETCASLIKRHMVSLRGSKYGQKVAFMVERWRGNPFSGNGSNNGNGGSLSQGSKSGSGSGSDGNGGNGGGRRRW